MDNWNTAGSAVLLKSNIVIVPEIAEKRGALYNMNPNKNRDSWIVDIKIRVGNEKRTMKGGNGVGIYYLRSIDK